MLAFRRTVCPRRTTPNAAFYSHGRQQRARAAVPLSSVPCFRRAQLAGASPILSGGQKAKISFAPLRQSLGRPVTSPLLGAFPISCRRFTTEASSGDDSGAASTLDEFGRDLPDNDVPMDSFLVEPTTTTAAASSAPPVPFDWWPPAEWLGDFMLAFHDTTSLGWIGTIMCFTVVVRVLVLPLVISTMKNTAKMAPFKNELDSVSSKNFEALRTGDQEAALMYRQQLKQLRERSGVRAYKTILPMIVQVPLFLTFFGATRRLAVVEPSLQDAGFWIFNNLAQVDPFYILPVVTSLTMLATIELGSEGTGVQTNALMKNMFRFMCIMSIPATSGFPIISHLYWSMSNVFSLGQLALFRMPAIAKTLGLPIPQGDANATHQSTYNSKPKKN